MVATVIIVLLILAAGFAFALIALIKLPSKQIQMKREEYDAWLQRYRS
jgi:CBS domain containing-hemolysin-like protein